MNDDQITQIQTIFQAEKDYFSGALSEAEYFQKAGAFLECSHAFGEGGEYICQECLANSLGVDSSGIYSFWDQQQT
jgi:hypothetical protein